MSKKEHFSVLVKGTNDCNLNCEYCFDRESRHKRLGKRLSLEDIDKIAGMLNDYAENISWAWHGGECTLMGKEFYEQAQDIFVKYYETEYEQSMQTNGILIAEDTSWVDLLADFGIEYGVSYDLHGQCRRDKKERDIMMTLSETTSHCGFITVITTDNASEMKNMYEKAKKLYGNKHSFSYNLGFEFANDETSIDLNVYQPSLEEYIRHWVNDTSNDAIQERFVMSLLRGLSGYMKDAVCSASDCRGDWFSVYGDGEIQMCDREMVNYSIGNLKDFNSVDEIFESESYKHYYDDVQKRYDNYCNKCPYLGRLGCRCVSNHTCANKDGLASEIDKRICRKYVRSLNVAYNVIQTIDSIDILNTYAYRIIHDDILFTPKEITKLLKDNNIEFDLNVPTDKLNKGELHNTIQYEIFCIFNPVRHHHKPYDLKCNNRNDLLQKIFELKQDLIRETLERGL